MAATFIDAANNPTSGDDAVTSRTCTKPAGAQLAIVWVTSWTGSGGGTLTGSGGAGTWVQRANQVNGQTRTTLFLKYVDGDATGTVYTFTFAGGATWHSLKAQFAGDVAAGLDLAAVPFNIATAGATAYPSVSVTTVTGAFLSWVGNAYEYSTGGTGTPPTDFTETGDTDGSSAAYRISPGDGSQAASGASFSQSTSNKQAALVAVAPASTGTPATFTAATAAATAAAHEATLTGQSLNSGLFNAQTATATGSSSPAALAGEATLAGMAAQASATALIAVLAGSGAFAAGAATSTATAHAAGFDGAVNATMLAAQAQATATAHAAAFTVSTGQSWTGSLGGVVTQPVHGGAVTQPTYAGTATPHTYGGGIVMNSHGGEVTVAAFGGAATQQTHGGSASSAVFGGEIREA